MILENGRRGIKEKSMKLIVPNRDLLGKLHSLAKSVPKNGNYRFVADDNKLNIYTESSFGYARGVVANVDIIQNGEAAITAAIIPTLDNASYPVELTLVDKNHLSVKHKTSGKNGLRLNLMSDPGLIGINPRVPNWIEEVDEIKQVSYLMPEEDMRIWITPNVIGVGNSFRFGVFRKEIGLNNMVISPHLIQRHYDFSEEIAIDVDGNYVWLGNDGYYIIVTKQDTQIPERLVELLNSEPNYEFLCIVNKEEFTRVLAMAKMLTKDDSSFVTLIFRDGLVSLIPTGNNLGYGNPEVEALRINGEFITKININYLSQAVKACKSDNLLISNLGIGNLTLLAIKDETIIHYIVPMV